MAGDGPTTARLYLVAPAEAAEAPVARFPPAEEDAGGASRAADLRAISAGDRPPARTAEIGPAPDAGAGPTGESRAVAELRRIPAAADRPARVVDPGAGTGRAGARRPAGRARRTADGPVDREQPDGGRPAAAPGRVADAPEQRPGRGSGRGTGRRSGLRPVDPDADPVEAAREICLTLLTDRARTKHELAEALRRRLVPDEAARAVLDRFDEVGLIDDAAFAGQWVRSRQRQRGLARRAIAVELRRKGVDDEVAAEALAEVDEPAEEERARELVLRKLRTVPAATPEQRVTAGRRLVGMLARKGYPAGLAYRVVREVLAAHGADVDELGTEPPED